MSKYFLKENEYLLTKQKVKGTQKVKPALLEEYYYQESNRRILGTTPYLYFYFIGEQFYDKVKIKNKIDSIEARYKQKAAQKPSKADKFEYKLSKKKEKLNRNLEKGNWVMRSVGEPPSIFSAAKMQKSAQKMEQYLFQNGYFYGSVATQTDTISKKYVNVKYQVTEGPQQQIRRVRYQSENPGIAFIVDSVKKQAPLQAPQPYNQKKLTETRDFFTQTIRNSGYYSFNRSYITASVDTTLSHSQQTIDLTINIANPPNAQHKPYRISKVNFTIDARGNTGKKAMPTDTAVTAKATYYSFINNLPTSLLNNKLLTGPGQLYNHSNLVKSQAWLAEMDVFRFVNFNIDTIGNQQLNLNIFTTLQDRYELTQEAGLVVSQGPPGPFANATVKRRNPFGGFEILSFSGRLSYEGQISPFLPDSIYRARELGGNLQLKFPRALIPLNSARQWLTRLNASTDFNLGLSNVRRPEYSRNLLTGSYQYSFQPSQQRRFTITPSEVNIINTTHINQSFGEFLNDLALRGNNLRESFRRSLVTNLGGTYIFTNQKIGLFERSTYLKLMGEFGGLFGEIIDQGFFESKNEIWGLQPFRFWRANADFRYHLPTAEKSLVAFRFNAGVAASWGRSQTLPYEKFYFVGGSNSVRAWAPRRLGPGSYTPQSNSETNNIQYTAEQPGNIILEANLEWRQTIISYLEGALFLDVGNVWTINQDNSRPGSQFTADTFYKEFALGTGFGFRFNFSFLVVRLDAGIRLYDPALPENHRWVAANYSINNPPGLTWNLGVGYPF